MASNSSSRCSHAAAVGTGPDTGRSSSGGEQLGEEADGARDFRFLGALVPEGRSAARAGGPQQQHNSSLLGVAGEANKKLEDMTSVVLNLL